MPTKRPRMDPEIADLSAQIHGLTDQVRILLGRINSTVIILADYSDEKTKSGANAQGKEEDD